MPGQSLVEAGESFKHLAEIKYNLEDNVKQNFIEPLTQTQNKDLKEVNVSHFQLNYFVGISWFQWKILIFAESREKLLELGPWPSLDCNY